MASEALLQVRPLQKIEAGADQPKAAKNVSKIPPRKTTVFATESSQKRYFLVLGLLTMGVLIVGYLLLTWGNSHPFLSEKWWRVSQMRLAALAVMGIVTFAQSLATITFQTVTNNRILTPSIMGFESLFILTQTALIYFLGVGGESWSPTVVFLAQTGMMVLAAVVLYSWLLSGHMGNLHVMLLVGIVIGTGLAALSTFMQRMLDPNEFDVLRARLFANIGSAKAELIPMAAGIAVVAGVAIWIMGRRLDVLSLGKQTSTNLGFSHKRHVMIFLTLVAALTAVSTALVGPMTFLGFLIASLTYTIVDTYDHRRLFPIAWLLGMIILGSAYFLLKHVFQMVDAVMIIVELLGGLTFLIVVLRKGHL